MAVPQSITVCRSLWLVLVLFSVLPVRADGKVCSIGRHGTMTTFNGETVTVDLPCKYRMADFTCAHYRVKVTPGSSVDDSGGFSPDTVWVKVEDLIKKEEGTFRTSLKRLAKFHNGEVLSPWKTTGGELSGAEGAVSYNRTARALIFSPVEQVSVVMLTDPPTVQLTCGADDFSSRPSPDTLCGDGTTSDSLERAALRVLGNDSDLTTQQFIHYVIMNDVTVTQSATCGEAANRFQRCPNQEDATVSCHDIFHEPSRVTCLTQSATPLEDYYVSCLRAVCDGDTSAIVAMETYVRDNCTGPLDNTKLIYRIGADPASPIGDVFSALLLDGGRVLFGSADLKELRLVRDEGTTTVSSVPVSDSPIILAQISDQQMVVSLRVDFKLLVVNVSGDALRVEREVQTDLKYGGLCPGPNHTVWASTVHGVRVDQLDLQGRVLRTVFHDTSGQFTHIFNIIAHDGVLYFTTMDGMLRVLSPATGEVTATFPHSHLLALGAMVTFDLAFDPKGDAYACVKNALCGDAGGCVAHVHRSGHVTVLPTFVSRPSERMFCVSLMLRDSQLLVTWLYSDQSGQPVSEITVQSLPQ